MNDLTVGGEVVLRRHAVDFKLRAKGSSATVTAALEHANKSATGVVRVETPLVAIGIALRAGKSQVKIFAGQDWLDERVRAVEAEEARLATIPSISDVSR
jgi:hypothetical protein